jgi:hypothetical protein
MKFFEIREKSVERRDIAATSPTVLFGGLELLQLAGVQSGSLIRLAANAEA